MDVFQESKETFTDTNGCNANIECEFHAHSIHVGSNDGADQENREFIDTKNKAIFRGNTAFLLSFVGVKWGLKLIDVLKGEELKMIRFTCMETHIALQKFTTTKVAAVSHCCLVKLDKAMMRELTTIEEGVNWNLMSFHSELSLYLFVFHIKVAHILLRD